MSKVAGGFRSYSPLVKILLWMAAIVVSAAVLQAVAWLVGLKFDILSQSGGGRGVLLALALATLSIMMAADRRPAADYGLAAGARWARHWLGGLTIGVLTYSAYCTLAWLCGALVFTGQPVTAYRCTSATLSAFTAVPVATTQQIIFSGYLLSTLRDRYRPITAALISGLLFAVFGQLLSPAGILAGESGLLVGLFLIATLLSLLRLRGGNILFPAGLLAGWIFTRRMIRKTALLTISEHEGLVGWMAPNNDPRQAPLLWIFVAAAVAVFWYRLHRYGETRPASTQPALHANFKRVFPLSNLNGLAPLDLWLRQLIDARFRVGLKYIPRLIAILVFSTICTIPTLPERLLAPWLLRRRKFRPVFIVGTHRTGTTHLHNMLALDAQFRTPRTCHIINPVGWLSLGWLTTPVLGPFMTWTRPMDRVRLHIFTPQEEEFAIAGMCRQSPYWAMSFPRRVAEHDRYIFTDRLPPKQRAAWQAKYLLFIRKLMFGSRKRALLKSPYNTGRVGVLREMFADAKFVHIHRHPYDVYASNRHMARNGFVVFQLQDPDAEDCFETRFPDNYRALEEAFARDAAALPSGDVSRVRFEDVERDPIAEIRRIYAELGLEYTESFHRRLVRYLEGIADYQKNRYHELPESTRREIDAKMGRFMDAWGYGRSDSTPADRPVIRIEEERRLKKAG